MTMMKAKYGVGVEAAVPLQNIPIRLPSFLKGIERYDAVLNGQAVPAVVADLGPHGFRAFSCGF
jgi:hypothetical protein